MNIHESTSKAESAANLSRRANTAPFLEIIEVKSKRHLKQFVQLPQLLYRDPTSPYVMPLEMHVKMMMGKPGSPDKHFLLAFVDGQPVARLGIKVHRHGKKTDLHFGFYECSEEYPQATNALFEKAHSMYPDLKMMGPFHFRQEDPYVGLLVEGFEHDPYFMMPYNPPSYGKMLEQAGLQTAMDLYTYDARREESLPENIMENAREAHAKGVTVRTLDGKNLQKEARIIANIFNDALSKNWGYEEFTEEQINEMVMLLKLFIDPRVVAFAQKDGKDIGCLIMIPNYNPIIKPSRGKLGPGLIWRFLKGKRSMKTIRGYALGVMKAYHGLGVGSALTDAMYKIGAETGYDRCEISWILANNGPMNELSKAMGGKQNKVYRIYEKPALNLSKTNTH